MKVQFTNRKRRKESGIALLISIFILLLISVVAIALIVSSGTETAMAGNYRTATSAYYAALAGLEEGRGRLLGKNSGAFNNTAPALAASYSAMGQPVYIINPVGGEVVAPWIPLPRIRILNSARSSALRLRTLRLPPILFPRSRSAGASLQVGAHQRHL